MSLTLRIDGVYAQTLGYGTVGDLEVQHRYSSTGGGLQVVSFKLACPPNYTHRALRQGALVQVLRGTQSLGWGVMADPDRSSWSFTVDGVYRLAENFLAMGSTNPSVVVAAANARGLGWNGVGNLPDYSISTGSEEAQKLNTVADVLNEFCRLNNLRWGLDGDNTPYVTSDPTEPTVALTPGVPGMATATDNYASSVTVRYVTADDGATPPVPTVWDTATVTTPTTPHGAREYAEDISDLGTLANNIAVDHAQALLDVMSARPGFTQSVEVAPSEVTTLGGQPLAPWADLAGRRVRHFGVLDSDGQNTYGNTLEWVIGATTYKPADGSLVLTPTEVAARTVAQVQADLKARTKPGFQ